MFSFLMGVFKNWKIGAMVSLVSGVSATIYIQHLEIEHEKHALVAAKAEYGLLQQSNLELLAATRRQNDAVAALAEEYQQKQKRVTVSLARAQKEAARYRQAAKTIAQSTLNGKDDCARLRSIINDYAAMAQKEKF